MTGSASDAPGTPAPSGTYRIFDYRDALPTWAFIMLLALIVIPVVFALYGASSWRGRRGLGLLASVLRWGHYRA